jgi:hypothetical protein
MIAHINHVTALTEMSNNLTARVCHSTMHGIFSQVCVELVLRSFFFFFFFFPQKAETMTSYAYSPPV